MPTHSVRDDQQSTAGGTAGFFLRSRQRSEILVLRADFSYIGPHDRLNDKPAGSQSGCSRAFRHLRKGLWVYRAETVVDYSGYSRATLIGAASRTLIRMHADGRWAQGQWALVCLLCFAAIAQAQPTSEALRHAQQLAWKKEFAAAEKAYRAVLRQFPDSRDAKFGLAQVLLWEGRYRDARRLFGDVLRRNSNDAAVAIPSAASASFEFRRRTS